MQAEIIADSINLDGNRITTFILDYPRFIHSELMTHRAFSRNAASSRAIPLKKMIEMIFEKKEYPVYWAKNQKGMQATEQVTMEQEIKIRSHWESTCHYLIWVAESLHSEYGLHKAICNRLLEPFAPMRTIVTATEYQNFFGLRAHPDAQQEFQLLAYLMLEQYLNSVPVQMDWGNWHIPFNRESLDISVALKVCTARCARISYYRGEGSSVEKDCELHDRLKQSGHWSPFEHCAQASQNDFTGNFLGWTPYRKMFSNENRQLTRDQLQAVYDGRPEWVKTWEHRKAGQNG